MTISPRRPSRARNSPLLLRTLATAGRRQSSGKRSRRPRSDDTHQECYSTEQAENGEAEASRKTAPVRGCPTTFEGAALRNSSGSSFSTRRFTAGSFRGGSSVVVRRRSYKLANASSLVNKLVYGVKNCPMAAVAPAATAIGGGEDGSSGIIRTSAGRTFRTPMLRVVVVDDSKPFRLKLRAILRKLFDNITVTLCASPKEGICTVLGASAKAPIHFVIVDQVYVGSSTTGQEMCDVLARRSNALGLRHSGRGKHRVAPCVLISGCVDVSAGKKNTSPSSCPHALVSDVRNSSSRTTWGRRQTTSSLSDEGDEQLSLSRQNASTTNNNYYRCQAHNIVDERQPSQGCNIVERCHKRDISSGLICHWFDHHVSRTHDAIGGYTPQPPGVRRINRMGAACLVSSS